MSLLHLYNDRRTLVKICDMFRDGHIKRTCLQGFIDMANSLICKTSRYTKVSGLRALSPKHAFESMHTCFNRKNFFPTLKKRFKKVVHY